MTALGNVKIRCGGSGRHESGLGSSQSCHQSPFPSCRRTLDREPAAPGSLVVETQRWLPHFPPKLRVLCAPGSQVGQKQLPLAGWSPAPGPTEGPPLFFTSSKSPSPLSSSGSLPAPGPLERWFQSGFQISFQPDTGPSHHLPSCSAALILWIPRLTLPPALHLPLLIPERGTERAPPRYKSSPVSCRCSGPGCRFGGVQRGGPRGQQSLPETLPPPPTGRCQHVARAPLVQTRGSSHRLLRGRRTPPTSRGGDSGCTWARAPSPASPHTPPEKRREALGLQSPAANPGPEPGFPSTKRRKERPPGETVGNTGCHIHATRSAESGKFSLDK